MHNTLKNTLKMVQSCSDIAYFNFPNFEFSHHKQRTSLLMLLSNIAKKLSTLTLLWNRVKRTKDVPTLLNNLINRIQIFSHQCCHKILPTEAKNYPNLCCCRINPKEPKKWHFCFRIWQPKPRTKRTNGAVEYTQGINALPTLKLLYHLANINQELSALTLL